MSLRRSPARGIDLVAAAFAALVPLCFLAACGEEVVFTAEEPWADPSIYPAIGDGKVLVTNSGDDTLTWLELATLEPVFHEPVGRLPPEREGIHHGAAALDGSAYFVGVSNFVPNGGTGPHGAHGTGTVDGYLLKYDTRTHALLGETRVDRSPGDVRLTPDGRYVLQSHFDLMRIQEVAVAGGSVDEMNARLAVIDAATMERVAMVEVCPAPHGIAIARDGSAAYVACWGSDELGVVSLADFAVTRHRVGPGTTDPTQPTYEPYAVAVSPTDGSVWVSCLKTGDLRVFRPETGTFDPDPIPIGGAPFFGDFTADGALYAVAVQGLNQVAFVDTATRSPGAPLALPSDACDAPHAVVMHPDDTRAIVVCEGDHVGPGTIAGIRLAPAAIDVVHPVGVYPDDAIFLRAP